MTRITLRVLLLEDDPDDAELVLAALRRGRGVPCAVTRVDTEGAFRSALSEEWDAVLADYRLPSFSGAAALGVLAELGSDVPCIVVSGAIGDEAVAEVIRAGAVDFVAKDRLGRLPDALWRSVGDAQEHRRRAAAEAALVESRHRTLLLKGRVVELDRRRRDALELNDSVLQRLVVAQAALQGAGPGVAETAVSEALDGLRSVMAGLVPEELVPGCLRRDQPVGAEDP